jgi:hypothetical protein
MLKTLAAKRRSTVTKTVARHRAEIETGDGPRTCYEARKHREGKQDLGRNMNTGPRRAAHPTAPARGTHH